MLTGKMQQNWQLPIRAGSVRGTAHARPSYLYLCFQLKFCFLRAGLVVCDMRAGLQKTGGGIFA